MTSNKMVQKLLKMKNPANIRGMERFGINPKNALGINIPELRKLAKNSGKNHGLAQKLWNSELHEARILASMVEVPDLVSEQQMEEWVKTFDSWDLCDQVCLNLFDKTVFSYKKAMEWSSRKEEFVKRAGFVLMAVLSVHDKKAPDSRFIDFLGAIRHESYDSRNFVKKAINWALRQIGKRNLKLNRESIKTAQEILANGNKSALWIASNALREIKSKEVQDRVRSC